MTDTSLATQGETPKPKNNFQLTKKARIVLFWWQIIAIIFWTYAIIQVFIFDIDSYLTVKDAILLTLLVKYKFLFLIGVLAVSWFFVSTSSLLFTVCYIIFYPLIFIVWKVPKLLWRTKSLIVTIAFINVLISFFKSIKYVFVTTTFIIIFSFLIFLTTDKYIIILSVSVLPILLLIIYVNRFIIILKPSSIYQIHSKTVTKILTYVRNNFKIDEQVKAVSFDQLNETQLATWGNNLQILVIANRGCYFLSSKLKEYQKSNVKVIFYIVNLFILIILTTLIFAVVNLGLYKINPEFFQTTIYPNFFIFIYYSVSKMFAQSITEIIPFANISRLFSIIQILFSFFLLGIILTLVFSLQNQRDSTQIDEVINEINKRGVEMDSFIQDEYKLSIEQAVVELERIKVLFINLIYYLTRNIN